MATFITRLTLMPINLSRLQWAFHDLKSACEEKVSQLFATRCSRCGKEGTIEFVVRDGDLPILIAYRCVCWDERLFKDPDKRDKSLDDLCQKKRIPYWYPRNVPLPVIQRERFQYIHELFTKRNLIALSIILNAIEKLENQKISEVIKLAFTAALDKCSRLKPLSLARRDRLPALSQGWIAVRFYTPKMWQEVNPWYAFERSFRKVYAGKQESNEKLKYTVEASCCEELTKGNANVLVLTGSADTVLRDQLPERSVDYVLTDPPFGSHIQYMALSTFWGAWLKFHFDYDRELVVNRHRGKTIDQYERQLGESLMSIRRVNRTNGYIHIFYQDVRGPYLHKLLKSMEKCSIVPERVIHQPPPKSFGSGIRVGKAHYGHYGSYIVRGKTITKSSHKDRAPTEKELRKTIAQVVRAVLGIRDGRASVGALLHAIYQKLSTRELLAFAKHEAEAFIKESIKEFALMNTTEARLVHNVEGSVSAQDMRERIRNGLLDVRSLYVNEEGKKNQYYQGYLHKFQADGMTIDDIRFVDETISSHEVDIRREQRVPELLLLFGKMLDFESERINEGDNKVVWKAKEGVSVSFRVTNKGISVSASQRMLEGVPVSEVGIIRDRELESALYKWCLRNPDKSRNLMNRLIPMAKSSKPQASPEHRLLRVLSNDKLCPDHYMITLAIPSTTASEPRPGQFFHVVCDPDGEKTITNDGEVRGYALTLRRPFSVHRIRYANFDRRLLATPTIIPYEIKEIIRRPIREVDILYKVVGKGTKDLSRVAPGNHLDVIGPLGNGFNTEKVDTAVIVAGGIGVAPLVALAERLRYSGSKVFPYFGALKKELFRPILGRTDSTVEITFRNGEPEFLQHINHVFREIGAEEVKICTDDGSLGERARVPDLLRRDIESGFLPSSKLAIFACGPLDMIRAVCKIANKHKIPGQVLLEERMACGIGACFSCTCRVQRKNGTVEKVRVCKDGPVFKAEEIL